MKKAPMLKHRDEIFRGTTQIPKNTFLGHLLLRNEQTRHILLESLC